MEDLRKEINKLERLLKEANEYLKKPMNGKLRCINCHGHYQYYVDGKYLPKKDREIAVAIAKTDYYRKATPLLKKMIRSLKQIETMQDWQKYDDLYEKACESKKSLLADLSFKSIADLIRNFEQQSNPETDSKYEITSEFYTMKGERVRSKSEVIIADILASYNLPYKYELPLNLISETHIVTLHPDFTVINPKTGKQVYIEHFGMMSNPEYAANSIDKILLYSRNGLLLGSELLVFFETEAKPLNTRIVRDYIERYLL